MKLKEYIEKVQSGQGKDLKTYLERFVPDVLLKSATLQEAFGVEKHELEKAYTKAFVLYEENNYQEAKARFEWLVTLNPFIFKFWMGLGGAQEMLGEFEKALHAYAIATLINSESVTPHERAAFCYEKLGNTREAEIARRLAQRRGMS